MQHPTAAPLVQWTARILGGFLVGLFLVMFFGEGIDLDILTAADGLMFLLLFVMFLGVIVAWVREGPGVVLGAAAFLLFAGLGAMRAHSATPALIALPFAVTTILHFISWRLHRGEADT